jgi:ABC-type Fe3+/spermidine/putrescine transport system ATPase subunit
MTPLVGSRGRTVPSVISPQPAISLQGVAKSYGRQPALYSLDLDIADGEFFCLLGPSGCGKTTTLNIIGGFVEPSAGAVLIHGTRVDQLPPHRRDVNTVFQSYALFPHMSVSANVGFGLKMAGVARDEARRRVREAIEMVGLEELESRLPADLSGGQQQRVAVARALVNRPAVLLLDEPLGALDLKLRKRLQVELAEIHREVGGVFVYVTHDQEEALALADRIAVMRDGRIEQVGTPEEIYSRPRSRFVAEFIGESNFFPGELVGAEPGRTVMVRPEALVLSDEDGLIGGEVLHSAFLGSCTRVAIRCEGSAEPVIAELHGSAGAGTAAPEPGQHVWLSWESAAAVAIEELDLLSEAGPVVDGEEVVTCTRE